MDLSKWLIILNNHEPTTLIRLLDLIISGLLIILLSPILIVIYIILFAELKSPIFSQQRLGKHLKPFTLKKFRTMKIGTPSLGTHKISTNYLTTSGKMLRRTKLDELPQLINVIKGEMSLVGPRPCLPNQSIVVQERQNHNVFMVRPGITGLSQISDIDMSQPRLLAKTDKYMIDTLNVRLYFSYLFKTAIGKGKGDRINKNA